MAESSEQFRGHSRLPRCAEPLRYDLLLRPDLAACIFSGSATVAVDVSAPTRFLVLNAAELSVDGSSVLFQARAGTPTPPSRRSLIYLSGSYCGGELALQDWAPTEVVQFEEDEILVIGFDKELPIGEGVLTMNFTGTLNDQMRGFYRR